METNPITELRQELRMDRRSFAVLLGVDYRRLYDVERGYLSHFPGPLARGLREAGFDAEELAARYGAWREAQRQEALRRVV